MAGGAEARRAVGAQPRLGDELKRKAERAGGGNDGDAKEDETTATARKRTTTTTETETAVKRWRRPRR